MVDTIYNSNEMMVSDNYPPAKYVKNDEGFKKLPKPKEEKPSLFPDVAREYYDHLSSSDLLPEESVDYFSKKPHIDMDDEPDSFKLVDELEPLPYMQFDLDRSWLILFIITDL